MPEAREFYVYAVYELVPGKLRELVYIGKGHKRGRYTRIARYKHLRWVKHGELGRRAVELAALRGKLESVIIKSSGADEAAAFAYEDFAIKACLSNPALAILNGQTGGGAGRTFTAATRQRLSRVHLGVKLPESARLKLASYWRGVPKTASHREAIRLAKLGQPRAEACKLKISLALTGKKYARRKTRLTRSEWQQLGLIAEFEPEGCVLDAGQRKLLRAWRQAARRRLNLG